MAELARYVELVRDEDWSVFLYGQFGDVCRDSGCFGMVRECYFCVLINTIDPEDRDVLEYCLIVVK